MAARSYAQYCGVVTALELVGERWALLIVRDLLVGPRRYTDLKQGLPRIPTNILSTRLKELQSGGVVRRVPLTHRGPVYELTDYGRELEEVVLALGRWGFKAMGAPRDDDSISEDSLTMALRTAFRSDVAATLPPTRYLVHVASISLKVAVDGPHLRVTPIDSPVTLPAGRHDTEPVDVAFRVGPQLRDVISGELRPQEAVDRGVITVLDEDSALLDRFAQTFHLDGEIETAGAGVSLAEHDEREVTVKE